VECSSTGWNSSATKSDGLQALHGGQTLLPCVPSRGTTEDDHQQRGVRSSCVKYVKKDAADVGSTGGNDVDVALPAAKTTMSWLHSLTMNCHVAPSTGQWIAPLPSTMTVDTGRWWPGWVPPQSPWSVFGGLRSATVNSLSDATTASSSTRPVNVPPSTHMRSADFKVNVSLVQSRQKLRSLIEQLFG